MSINRLQLNDLTYLIKLVNLKLVYIVFYSYFDTI
jgi:hypothetical protein